MLISLKLEIFWVSLFGCYWIHGLSVDFYIIFLVLLISCSEFVVFFTRGLMLTPNYVKLECFVYVLSVKCKFGTQGVHVRGSQSACVCT